ncbi:MAG: nucleotidyl transferase AbiEii/AbiGii toxin family protein [Sulfurimonas sp.]|uniref:nucleotidyl transferase AbiEii/AbiGii toxin family protein n=1 Tax=Sulfurimonas sp. TaxID=2022749 RepID=UPI0025F6E8F1|nr:nucleotidyl transferase AbiEii/AbiGii toxin family protein [Sulfurimonas sp.]MCK9492134.1 nucleotidyl transferase AbiEii/AbiGii toxin family protein [Sulfurimonas sp.]
MTLAVKKALTKLASTALFERELYFIGGTALAYYLCHRISEDVDIVSPKKLPYKEIESAMLSLGAVKQKDIYESALRINGLNPSEYMLKFLLDDVKVEFFAASTNIMKSIIDKAMLQRYEPTSIKMLDLKSISKLKLIALLNRIKSRDIYDLNEIIKSKILSLDEILYLCMEVKKITTSQELIRFIENMQEKDDDEIVYLDEKFPIALNFKELQKELIENIGRYFTNNSL